MVNDELPGIGSNPIPVAPLSDRPDAKTWIARQFSIGDCAAPGTGLAVNGEGAESGIRIPPLFSIGRLFPIPARATRRTALRTEYFRARQPSGPGLRVSPWKPVVCSERAADRPSRPAAEY